MRAEAKSKARVAKIELKLIGTDGEIKETRTITPGEDKKWRIQNLWKMARKK